MNCISFSLFGTAPIYLNGALKNSQMVPHFYPGWQAVFFVEQESVPADVIAALLAYGADVRLYSRLEYPNGMFSRFLIADDPNVERFICRDVDSRPSQREVNAVNAWIDSGKLFHILRDHPWHQALIMGGLWGAKGGALKNVKQAIKSFRRARHPYSRDTQYGADQEFLLSYVWPKARTNSLIHDSFRVNGLTGEPFPDGLSEGDFVGSISDHEDKPIEQHVRARNDAVRRMT